MTPTERDLFAEIHLLGKALRLSLELQNHYAKLLNSYDSGKRRTFSCNLDWFKALSDSGDYDAKRLMEYQTPLSSVSQLQETTSNGRTRSEM